MGSTLERADTVPATDAMSMDEQEDDNGDGNGDTTSNENRCDVDDNTVDHGDEDREEDGDEDGGDDRDKDGDEDGGDDRDEDGGDDRDKDGDEDAGDDRDEDGDVDVDKKEEEKEQGGRTEYRSGIDGNGTEKVDNEAEVKDVNDQPMSMGDAEEKEQRLADKEEAATGPESTSESGKQDKVEAAEQESDKESEKGVATRRASMPIHTQRMKKKFKRVVDYADSDGESEGAEDSDIRM